MILQARREYLIRAYLSYKLKKDVPDEKLVEYDHTHLNAAIDFYYSLCGEFLNLDAVASGDEPTRQAHSKQKEIFFELLDKSLKIKEGDGKFAIVGFDKLQAALSWLTVKPKIDLKTIHADIPNLAIAEKFLAGKLHGQEWLTEVDLGRLTNLLGLNVGITRLNKTDLGMIFHFNREQHKSNETYFIPLLVNLGSSGNISSQGTHWASLVLKVDPKTQQITVLYQDSMGMSDLAREQIQKIINDAVNYTEISNVADVIRTYQAFPGYQVNFEINDGNDLGEVQADQFTCGGRALSYTISAIPVKNAESEALTHFRSISAHEAHAESYKLLLSSMEVPEQDLDQYATEQFPRATFDGKARIQESYLKEYLTYIATVKPSRKVVTATPEQLSELVTINKQAEIYLKEYQEKFPLIDGNLVIDFSQIFSQAITELNVDAKAKLKAIANLIAQNTENFTKLIISNFDLLNHPELHIYFVSHLDALPDIYEINIDTKNDAITHEIQAINYRNRLIKFLDLQIDKDEDIWDQFWQRRFADSTLYKDQNPIQLIFSLYASNSSKTPTVTLTKAQLRQDTELLPKDQNEDGKSEEIKIYFDDLVNYYVEHTGVVSLQKLLSFLDINADFFKAKDNGFPFQSLTIGPVKQPNDETINTAETLSKLSEDYLDALTTHLNANRYFPFQSLTLTLNNFKNFEKLKEFLIAISNYPHVETISLVLMNSELKRMDLTPDQYEELAKIFSERKLTCNLNVEGSIQIDNESMELKKKIYDLKLDEESEEEFGLTMKLIQHRNHLDNIIANNRRKFNIQLAKKVSHSPIVEPRREQKSMEPRQKPIRIRPYKLTGYDVRQNVSVDINTNADAEVQQQFQMQTQLQQEVQLQVQVQAQEETLIDSMSNTEHSTNIVSRKTYQETKEYMHDSLQACKSVFLTSAIMKADKAKLGTPLWNFVFGQDLPFSVKFITKDALEKLHENSHYFLFGIDLDNLPEGFFLQQVKQVDELLKPINKNRGLILCYDEVKAQENKNHSPLTVVPKPIQRLPPWKGDLRTFIPDGEADVSFDGIFRTGRYDAPVHDKCSMDKLHKFMRGLNPELAAQMLETHKWILDVDNDAGFQTGGNIYFLMDILYFSGCEGLNNLLTTLQQLFIYDEELYLHFKKLFIDNNLSSRNFLDPSFSQSVADLLKIFRQSSTNAEKTWWLNLVSQHQTYTNTSDFVGLVRGFDYFLKQFPKEIPLPNNCPIKECSNMLVGLDRLLSMLSKVKSSNLVDQIGNLNGLSFTIDGAWYAGRFEGFHYFHPEMRLNPKDILDLESIWFARKASYKVGYQELKLIGLQKTSSGDSFDISHLSSQQTQYPFVLFHRFIGGCERINSEYDYYVKLISQLTSLSISIELCFSLLPLLAVSTTGERGANVSIDPNPLFDFITQNEGETLTKILHALIETINDWPHKPNLNELFALLRLTYESKKSLQEVLAILAPDKSLTIETFKAINLWQQNSEAIDAEQYLELYKTLQARDAGNAGKFATIAAILKQPYEQKAAERVIELFNSLKNQPAYPEVLATLAIISVEKTEPQNLPSLLDLETILQMVDGKEANQIFAIIKNALPLCEFDFIGGMDAQILNINTFQAKVKELNESIEEKCSHLVNLFDAEKMQGQGAADYINGQLSKLADALIKKYTLVVFDSMKNSAMYPKILDAIKAVVFAPLDIYKFNFPELGLLLKPEFFNFPALSGKYESIGEDFSALSSYAAKMNKLFESLRLSRLQWGSNFTLDFLLNSPRTRGQFSVDQVLVIIDAINKLESNYVPISILQAIFADKPFSNDANLEIITKQILSAIQLTNFTLAERASLVTILISAPSLSENIINLLNKIKSDEDPALMNGCMTLLKKFYSDENNKDSDSLLTELNNLLKIKDNNVKKIILTRLSGHPEQFLQLSQRLHGNEEILKILAYACLQREDDAKNLDDIINPNSNEDILQLLLDLKQHKKDRFNELLKLFNERPFPKLHKLQQILISEKDESLVDYELDPPGLRKLGTSEKDTAIKKQFDIRTAHIRIDQIQDLKRNGQPLFKSQRDKLYSALVYVNGIGHSNHLNIPLMTDDKAAKYKKPVMDLSKKEIQELIQHYKKIISGETKATAKEIYLAKLEFVALANEAMYRASGNFPYSTQTISLLNALIHGGNIFSEIRTGEGKGLITALFAASKWMEGGSVDVCSANMELARRDIEEFGDFYEYLGIQTKLITSKTKPEDYLMDGIHYSDVSELALFQEKMELSHAPMPEKVSCVLDEGDFIALDNNTAFRYATSLDANFDPHKNPNEWVYPVILQFVSRKDFIDKQCDESIDRKDLRDFVAKSSLSAKLKVQFGRFSDTQLDRWIDSAYAASQYVEGEDFVVRNQEIERGGQLIPAQIARVKNRVTQRESLDSQFSNGTHQFLHTRLNLEMLNKKRKAGPSFPINPEKTYLASRSAKNFIDYYLKRGNVLALSGTSGSESEIEEMQKNYGFAFYRIPPHEQLKRNDHSPKLAKRSRKGFLGLRKARVTIKSQEEMPHGFVVGNRLPDDMKDSYILVKQPNMESWQLIYVDKQNQTSSISINSVVGLQARLKELSEDYDESELPNLDKDDHAALRKTITDFETAELGHFQKIHAQIKECLERDQPILIICDSVQSSERLNAYLLEHLSAKEKLQLQCFNSERTNVTETEVVKAAGLSGMITISTSMLGRGTNIIPRYKNGRGVPSGLAIIDTYISPYRDYGQKIGRAGRNGDYGDSYLIVSEAEFEKYGKPIPKNQKQLEATIDEIRNELTEMNAAERLEKQTFSDIKEQFFNAYIQNCRKTKTAIRDYCTPTKDFRPIWKMVEHASHLEWEHFLNSIDKKWTQLVTEMQNQLRHDPSVNLQTLLDDKAKTLRDFAKLEWEETVERIQTEVQIRLDETINRQVQELNVSSNATTEPLSILLDSDIILEESKPIPEEEIYPDIQYTRLNPATMNPYKVSFQLTGNEEYKGPAFKKEIDIIYDQIVGHQKLDKVYKKFFGTAVTEDQTVAKAKVILQTLLNKYHTALKKPHLGLPAALVRFQIEQLIVSVRDLCPANELDNVRTQFTELYQQHVRLHEKDPSYIRDITQQVFRLRETNVLSDKTFIQVFGDQQEQWLNLKKYATNQLKHCYSPFARKKNKLAVQKLLTKIADIDDNLSAQEKIQELMNILNEASALRREKDHKHDSRMHKFSLFSYRHEEGDALQQTMERIRDKAMTYIIAGQAQEQEQKIADNSAEITHVVSLLEHLTKFAELPKLKNRDEIKIFNQDKILQNLIANLKEENNPNRSKYIPLILDRLESYTVSFENLRSRIFGNTESTNAFMVYYNNVKDALRKISQIPAASNDSEYAHENERLRRQINYYVRQIVKDNLVAKKRINLDSYSQALHVDTTLDDATKLLLKSALFEIDRSFLRIMPGYKKTSMSAIYDQAKQQLEVTVNWDKGSGPVETKIIINGFSNNPATVSRIMCELPVTLPTSNRPAINL